MEFPASLQKLTIESYFRDMFDKGPFESIKELRVKSEGNGVKRAIESCPTITSFYSDDKK